MTTPASALPDAELERKIRNAERQLAHQDTGFFVPFDEYIPVYRELLERRSECARLRSDIENWREVAEGQVIVIQRLQKYIRRYGGDLNGRDEASGQDAEARP